MNRRNCHTPAHRHRLPAILAACLLAPLLTGCPASTSTHAKLCEGGSSAFDCAAFATLATAHDTIEAAKVEFPDQRADVNAAVAAFNLASDAYVAYHELAKADPATDRAELDRRLASLLADLVPLEKLLTQRKGTP